MTGLQCRGDLLDRLAKLDELIAGQKATLALLERERFVLQTKLRLVEGRPSRMYRGRRA